MKRLSKLSLLLAGLFIFAGCGQKAANSEESVQESKEIVQEEVKTDEEVSNYPLTIKTYDFSNKPIEVTIEKMPEKVFVDGVNNVEIMLALGLGDKIAMAGGVSEVKDEFADAFAKINSTDELPSKEDVIALQPDFLLGWYGVFQDKLLGDVYYWHESGIPTYMSLNSYAMGPGVPLELKNEYEDILTIGKIFGVEEKAQAIVNKIQSEADKAKAFVEGKDSVKTVVLESSGENQYMIYGTDTLVGSMIDTLGGEQVMTKTEKSDVEALIEANPDVIFVVYFASQNEDDAVKPVKDNPALASLKAVQDDKVYGVVLSDIYCSGVRTYDGMMTLINGLYPELN